MGEQPKQEKTVSQTTFIVTIVVSLIVIAGVAFIYNQQLTRLQSNYDTLLNEKNSLQNNYNALNSTYSSLLTSYNTLYSQSGSLQSDYNTLQSQYSSLQSNYNSLQSSYNYYYSAYNSLSASYSNLQSSYSSLQSSYSSLQIDRDNLYNIVNLGKSQTLDTNRPVSLTCSGSQTISYSMSYAGYITITFNAQRQIYLEAYSSYIYTWYARYPLSGTATSGTFKIPVLPGTTSIYIQDMPGILETGGQTVVLSATYVY